MTLSMSDSVLC